MTTIALSKETKSKLESLKSHPREPFEEVLQRILERVDELKKEGTW